MSEEYQDAQIADLKRELSDLRAKVQGLLDEHRTDQFVTLKELQQINIAIVRLEQMAATQEKWQEKTGGFAVKFLGVVLSFIILGVLAAVFPGGVDK